MSTATEERVVPRLKARYDETALRAQLQDDLGFGNIMQVPRLDQGRRQHGRRRRHRPGLAARGRRRDLTTITGQKPLVTRAKKSIAGFKLREGNAIGVKVTLRGDRMWEFMDRLISIAIPRIRDFRGLNPRSFDGNGNYTFGLTEQLVFPEIDYDSIDQPRGMDITIVTTAGSDAKGGAAAGPGLPVQARGSVSHGEEGAHQQAAAQAQVQGAVLHPLPPVRPPALGVPQVRAVPHLPARAGARGRAARRHQGELVRGGRLMTMTDLIADMLTRIRNANIAMHDDVRMPSSKLKEALAGVLRAGGLHRGLRRAGQRRQARAHAAREDEVQPRACPHDLGHPAGVQAGPARLLAVHQGPRVLGGLGVAVLSTSQGLLSDREARKRRVGGEVLCFVW